jgi:cation transport ATPase
MSESEPSRVEWDNLRFHGRRPSFARSADADPASTRFIIGILVFLAVAALYPWYSYRVQAMLLARELDEATEALEREAKRQASAAQRQLANAAAAQQVLAEQRRVEQVRVMGASLVNGRPVVIVDMGHAGLPEAGPTICRQAASWLDRPVAGEQLQVRRHRGKAPAVGVGTIRC